MNRYVLGIDLGANSVGWAALRLNDDGRPIGLLDAGESPSLGSRIFPQAVENYEQGEKEQPKNAGRRQKRLQRRQQLRRARRQRRTFLILQEAGLLPQPTDPDASYASAATRHAVLSELDANLRRQYAEELRDDPGRLPYFLRARALDAPMPRHELGRALYHLAQRRGFLSNRKSSPKKDDSDQGEIKSSIKSLREDLQSKSGGARTLGEFFHKLPREERIRRRWTARDMYVAEFEAIWNAQSGFDPSLNEATVREPRWKRVRDSRGVRRERFAQVVPLKDALFRALFFQRPLKSSSHLIGSCELENGSEYRDSHGIVFQTSRRRRAPRASLIFQEFRLLQWVNNLEIRHPDGRREWLLPEQRQKVFDYGQVNENVTFAQLRKLLGLQKPKGIRFNLEEARASLEGNRTNARLFKIFGDRWTALKKDVREAVVVELWSIESDVALRARALKGRGPWADLRVTEDEADAIVNMPLEGDYASLSRHAMQRLMPLMHDGMPFASARKAIYGETEVAEALDLLPPLDQLKGGIRNPVVNRALSELRDVVNAAVKKYGKPERIHLELARGLKKNKMQRFEIVSRNRKREKERASAAEEIRSKYPGRQDVRPRDVEKYLLAVECDWTCPYTGTKFGFHDLVNGRVEVEHIIPFSRSLDDSFLNKTLCLRDANRDKENKTPFEAFGGANEHDWPDHPIIERVRRRVEAKAMPAAKLERFLATDTEKFVGDFRARQLVDTAYASRLARRYLTMLYGGSLEDGVDSAGRRRVQVSSGAVTAEVRRALNLNSILGGDTRKVRSDHRHHAVDAVVIALTDAAMIKCLSDAASRPASERLVNGRPRRFGRVESDWPSVLPDVRDAVERVHTSHRISNRIRGALHTETLYSPHTDTGQPLVWRNGAWCIAGSEVPYTGSLFVHYRKPAASAKPDSIVDPRIREIVAQAQSARREPVITAKSGAVIPIRKVRVRERMGVGSIGRGERARVVRQDANHHAVLFEVPKKSGTKWEAVFVSLFEAHARIEAQRRLIRELCKAAGLRRATPEIRRQAEREQPIISRVHPTRKDAKFVMTLMNDEVLEIERDGRRELFIVKSLVAGKSGSIKAVRLNDASKRVDVGDEKHDPRVPLSIEALRTSAARKVVITPLGEIRRVGRA